LRTGVRTQAEGWDGNQKISSFEWRQDTAPYEIDVKNSTYSHSQKQHGFL